MNLKKILLLAIILVSVPLVSAGSINVRLVDTDPDALIPGSLVSMTFEATNTNDLAVRNVGFELKVPQSLHVETEDDIEFDRIGTKEKVLLSWVIRARESAVPGPEKVELIVKEDEESSLFFPLRIQNIGPTLVVKEVKATPEQAAPGEAFTIDVNLLNKAPFSLKNVNVKLSLANAPFAPMGSIDEQTIETIQAEGEHIVTFHLTALPESETGIYKIPLLVTYADEFGTTYSKENIVSLTVGSRPKLEISQETPALVLHEKSETSIKFVNTGLTGVKLLTVSVEPVNATLLSSSSYYIGDLEVDDFQTIDLELYPVSSQVTLIAHVTYKDANNKDFKETVRIPLSVYTADEAEALGLRSRSSMLMWSVAGLGVVVLFFVVRKLFRRT